MRTLIFLSMVTACSVFSARAMLWSGPARSMVISAMRMHGQQRFVSSSVAAAEYEWMGVDIPELYKERVVSGVDDIQKTWQTFAYENSYYVSHEHVANTHYDEVFPYLAAFQTLKKLDCDISNVLRLAKKFEVKVNHNDLQHKQSSVQKALSALTQDERFYPEYRRDLECRILKAQLDLLTKE